MSDLKRAWDGKQEQAAAAADMLKSLVDAWHEQRTQLAASQATMLALRDALVVLSYLGNGDMLGNSEGNVIAQRCLAATPPGSDAALRAIVERAALAGWAACVADECASMYGEPSDRTTDEHAAKRIVASLIGERAEGIET